MHHKLKSLFHNSRFAIVCPVPYHPSCHHLQGGKECPKWSHKEKEKITSKETSLIQTEDWLALWVIHLRKTWRAKCRILLKSINLRKHSLCTFCLHVLVFRGFSNINCEHDNFRCHGWHLVAEAKLVGSIHVCGHRVFSTGLSDSFVNLLAIRSCYL